MDAKKLAALRADTCWVCQAKSDGLRLVLLVNTEGEYDMRYDWVCPTCSYGLGLVGQN